jgi:hypothetical protein
MSETNVAILSANITTAIRSMKRDGITGASFACLKQCTSTAGLTCPVPAFHAAFDALASSIGRKLRFSVYA